MKEIEKKYCIILHIYETQGLRVISNFLVDYDNF